MPSGSVFERISGDVGRSDHPFLLGPTHHTYGDLLRAAERIARGLKERGAKPGSRVAVCLDQGLAYVASLIGIWQADAVSVLMAPDWAAREKERVLHHSGAAFALADAQLAPAAIPVAELEGLDCALFAYPSDQPETCEPGDAVIVYSSGSTGEPKGVVLTDSCISANVRAVGEYLAVQETDRVPIFTPTCYAYSLSQNLVQASMSAGIVAVPSGLMFPMDVLQSVSANKLTGISATPTALRILCNLALETDGKYESVRFIMCGGQPLDVGLVRLIESIFPNARVVNMYGCTENSPRITYHYTEGTQGTDDYGYFPVGCSVRGTELKVIANDTEALPGQIGEVAISGTSLMRTYWRDREATRERLQGNWFHTRDLGYRDSHGRLHITGRQSTIINVGNEKVSPEEVEKVLLEFPGVKDGAVYRKARSAPR